MKPINESNGSSDQDAAVRERFAPTVAPDLGDYRSGSSLEYDPVASTGRIGAPIPEPNQEVVRKKRHFQPKRWVRFGAIGAVLLLGLFIIGLQHAVKKQAINSSKASASQRYAATTIPLTNLSAGTPVSLQGAQVLSVNGQLNVSNSVVLSPSKQPSTGTTGQLYYDKTSNQLTYYNGTQFVGLVGTNGVVRSIGGAGGDIQLGNGLVLANGTLSITNSAGVSSIGGQSGAVNIGSGLAANNGQISNTGVLSLQGQTGNVSLTSGGGIAISGTTLTNSGVLSVGGVTGDLTLGNGLAVVGNQIKNTGILSATAGSNVTIVNDGNGNLTISSNGAGGTLTTPGGTIGKIGVFTGVQEISDSIITQGSGLITIGGNLDVTGGLTLGTPLAVTQGGTGSTTAAGARSNLGAAASGANTDITSLGGLTTALSVPQGGTGATNAAGARANLGAAGSGANTDITSLAGLTTALSVVQGGTGATSLTANGILLGNGTGAITAVTGTNGECLVVNGSGVPVFTTCPGSGGVTSVDSLNGVISIANTTGAGATITIDNAKADGTTKGIAAFNATDFQDNGSGVIDTIQGIATSSTPTFGGLTLSTALSVGNGGTGSTSAAGARSNLGAAASGANTDITSLGGLTTALSVGQGGTGSTSAGGARTNLGAAVNGINNDITSLTGLTTALAVTEGGTGSTSASGARANLGAAASGANTDITSLGGLTTALSVGQGGTGATSLVTNGVLIGQGTGAITTVTTVTAGECLVSTAGAPVFQACPGSGGVSSLDTQTGVIALANSSGAGGIITIDDATTSTKGIASFNSTNFTVSGGAVNTVQDITTTSAPTFGQLTVTSSQATNPILTVNNTNASGTGNLLDLQLNSISKLSVNPAGNLLTSGTITSGLINGQTISSTANFTGSVAVGTTLSVNTITPTSSLTVGVGTQSFTLQGNASSTLTATNAGKTTTVGFQSPTANVTYSFATAAAGSYSICTTAGNCSGVGGGVTTPGGTTDQLAKFTASGTIGDSIISDDGSTATIAGALSVNTITPTGALTVGDAGQNLSLQGAGVSLAANDSGNTNTLSFATPTSNHTVTVPDANGTVAVSASGPLSLDANGNLTCASCLTSGGGGSGGVSDINGLNGSLTLQGSSAGSITSSGATITVNDASSGIKGLASFNATNLTVTSGNVNTVQDIAVTSTPTFGGLTLTAALTVGNGGTGATSASGARTNLGAAASGANSDITSLTGLTTALSVAQGGTGIMTTPNDGEILIGNGSGYSLNTLSAGTGVTIDNTNPGHITISAAGAGTCSSCATTALSNLNSVAINTSLLPASSAGADLGSGTKAFGQLFLAGTSSSPATNNFKITGVSTGGTRTITLPDASGTVAVSASGYLSLDATTGNLTFVGPLAVTDGGTGSTSASGARTNLGAAASGVNNDITSLTGLTTALSVSQGGTGLASLTANEILFASSSSAIGQIAHGNSGDCLVSNGTSAPTFQTCTGAGGVSNIDSLTGAITLANSTGSGATITINDAKADGSTKGISTFTAANFKDNGSGLIDTIQGIATTSSPTFAALTLTAALSVANGGTGTGTFTNTNGVVYYDGTKLTNTAAGSTGQCLLGNTGGAPTFGTCTGAGGVSSLNTLTGALTIANATTAGSTITINDAKADGTTKGIAAFNGTNFQDNGAGVINTIQDITTTSNVGFGSIKTGGTTRLDGSGNLSNINTITQNNSGTGGSGNSFSTTNSGTSGLNSENGLNVALTGASTTGTNSTTGINFATPTNAGGTNNFYGLNFGMGYTDLLRYNGTQLISGTGIIQSAAISGSYTGITGVGTITTGTWQGTAIAVNYGGTGATSFANTNGVVYYDGTKLTTAVAGTTGQCLLGNTGGAPTFGTCTGAGGVSSINSQSGAITLQGTANQVSVSNTGTTFTIATPQNIDTGATPTFGGLTLTNAASLTLGTSGAGGHAGSIKFFDGSTAFTGTLNLAGALGSSQTYSLPTTGGTLCVQGSSSCGFAGTSGSGSYIQNQSASPQVGASFNIDGTGAVGSNLSVGGNITVATGKSITIVGSSTRPGSPTKGTLYFDTSTNQLIQYNGTKWIGTQKTAIIVAASDSSTIDKDAADYVASGTNDQSTINTAIGALPTNGGTVYLMAGNYNFGAALVITKDGVTLTGAGTVQSTINRAFNGSTLANGAQIYVNTDDVSISQLHLYGNKPTYTNGNNNDIYITGDDNKITSIQSDNPAGSGIYVGTGNENIISGNILASATADSVHVGTATNTTIANNKMNTSLVGVDASSNGSVTIIGNTIDSTPTGLLIGGSVGTISGNTITGANTSIDIAGGNKITVTGNTIDSNTASGPGILVETASDDDTITGNTIGHGGARGIQINNGANEITVSGNNLGDNAGIGIYADAPSQISNNTLDNNATSGALSGIVVTANGDNSTVNGNFIAGGGSTGFAIDVQTGASGVYLSNNTYSGTGATSIHDAGTGTIYSNQLNSTGQLINSASGALVAKLQSGNTNDLFQLQDASANVNASFNNTGNQLTLGRIAATGTVTQGKIVFGDGTTDNRSVTLQIATQGTGSFTLSIPSLTANATICTTTTCAGSSGSGNYIQNQNASPQTSANFNIDGTGTAATFNATTGYQINGTPGANTTCTGGQIITNQAVVGGITTGGTCAANGSGSTNLQGAYTASTGGATPEIVLDSTRNGIDIRDTSGGLGVNLFDVQNNAGSTNYFAVTATGISTSGTATATTAVKTPAIRPLADSTSALQIQNAAGSSNIITVDTTNGRIGIDTAGAPTAALQVTGTTILGGVSSAAALAVINTSGATEFNVDTSGHNVNVAQQANATSGTQAVNSDALNLQGSFWNGSSAINKQYSLTDIVSTGAVTSRLAFQNTAGTETMTLTDGGKLGIGNTNPQYAIDVTGTVNATAGFAFNGTPGATTTCSGGQVLSNQVTQGGIVTGGTCATNGAGATTTLQQSYTNSVGGTTPEIVLDSTRKGIDIQDASTTVGGNLFDIQNNGGTTNYFAVSTSATSITGGLTQTGGAVSLTGNAASSFTTTAGGINIDTTTVAGQTINIGNGNIGHTINIGSGTSTEAVTLGSGNGTSSTFVNGGSAGLTLQTGNNGSGTSGTILLATGTSFSGNSSVIVKSGTNSTTAFQIQNSSGVAILNADTTTGLIKIGTGVAFNTTATASITLPTTAADYDSVISGDYAYVSDQDNNKLYIYNISDPTTPTLVNTTTTQNGLGNMHVDGHYLYGYGFAFVYIYDISRPDNPVLAGSIDSNLWAYTVQSHYVYEASDQGATNELKIFDVSNPDEPLQISDMHFPAGGGARGITVRGGYAYIGETGGFIGIVSIGNPFSPAFTGQVGGGNQCDDQVTVSGSYAYTGCGNIFNIANPASPTLVSTSLPDIDESGVVSGNYLYYTHNGTFYVEDVSNPASLSTVTTFSTGVNLAGINGRYAFLDNGTTLKSYALPGAYVQQLQAGNTETGTLTVDTDASVGGNLNVQGGLGASSINAGNIGTNQLIIGVAPPSNTPSLGGDSFVNGTEDGGTEFSLSGSQITIGGSAVSVSYINVYIGDIDNYPNNKVQMAIYTDSSNAPNTLLVTGQVTTLTPNAWNSIPVPTTTLSASTKYWLVMNSNSTNSNLSQPYFSGTTGCHQAWLNTTAFGTWPTPFGSPSGTGTSCYAMYVSNAPATQNPSILQVQNTYGGNMIAANAQLNSFGIAQIYGPGNIQLSRTPNMPTLTFTGSGSGATYSYEVAPVDNNGVVGEASPAATSTTFATTLNTTNFVKVTIASSGASCYNVYRTASTGTSPSSTQIGLIGQCVGSGVFNDKGTTTDPVLSSIIPANTNSLTANTTYYYEITAVDSAGGETEADSGEQSINIPSGATGKAVLLSWQAVSGARSYNIYRATASGAEQFLATTAAASYIDTGTGTTINQLPPAISTAYESELGSGSNASLSIGSNGTATGQLYVSGAVSSNLVGSVAGTAGNMTLVGNYAYNAVQNGAFQVYDVSNPASPSLLGSTASVFGAVGVPQIVGHYAYVTALTPSALLMVFDISNPTNPTLITSVSTTSGTGSIYTRGNFAYVAGGTTLQTYDISNPANPKLVNTVTVAAGFQYVTGVGSYLYATGSAGTDGLMILSIANPAAPALVSTTATAVGENSVAVQGIYAYVGTTSESGFRIYNISNPASPSLIYMGNPSGSTNNLAYLYVSGRYLYGEAFGTIDIFDISTQTYPKLVSETGLNINDNSFNIQGRYAYFMNSSTNALNVVDLGGEYAQQLQAGDAQIGNLSIDQSANIGQDLTVSGGLNVGSSTSISGSLGVSGNVTLQNTTNSTTALQIQNATGTTLLNADTTNAQIGIGTLSAPGTLTGMVVTAAPSVTPTGGVSASKTYTYEIVAVDANGGQTLGSLTGTTGTGRATLTASIYNALSWSTVTGASNYLIYRTASTGSPSSTGLIASVPTGTTTFNDTGYIASNPAIPATGGSLGATTTYFYKVTALDSTGGQTLASTEMSKTTTSTAKSISVSWAPVAGARSYRVYRGTATGAENVYYSVNTNWFTDTGAANTGGTPPTTSSAYANQISGNAASQIIVGNSGTAAGQLYVGGALPAGATSSLALPSNGRTVKVVGKYAYVEYSDGSSNSGLRIYDISDPTNPILLSDTSYGIAMFGLEVVGHYAYIPIQNTGALYAVDVSNPYAPVTAGSSTFSSSNVTYVHASGRYLYLNDGNSLRVYDIAQPGNPVQVGMVTVSGNSFDFSIHGRYLYLSDAGNGFQVIDISNPAAPSLLGTAVGGTNPVSNVVQGNYDYQPNSFNGTLSVINIANPANPVVMNTVPAGTAPEQITIQGKYLYVLNYGGTSMQIFDISNPINPVSVGTVTTPAQPNSIAISGRYAYVAGLSSSSFSIYDLGGAYIQSLQAGSAELGSLSVDGTSSLNGDANIQGSLSVGQSTQLQGNLGVGGAVTLQNAANSNAALQVQNSTGTTILGVNTSAGSVSIGSLLTPTLNTPTSGSSGSPLGANTYYYRLTAIDANGGETAASNEVSITITAGKKITNTWTAIPGAVSYRLYRGIVPGGETGYIPVAGGATITYLDDGTVGLTTAAVPTASTAGAIHASGSGLIIQNTTNSTAAFQVQNAAGASLLSVDTTGSNVNIGKAGSLTGTLTFANATGSNVVGLQAGASTAAYTLTLPTTAPTGAGQCLTTASTTQLAFGSCSSGPYTPTISRAAGFPYSNTNSVTGTTSTLTTVNPTHIGDLVIFQTLVHNSAVSTTGLSGGNVGSWSRVNTLVDATNNWHSETWIGTATATGTATVTATFSASLTSTTVELVADSLTSGLGAAGTWSVDQPTHAFGTASITPFANLTPTTTGAAYWGYQGLGASPATGNSGAPFTFSNTALGNVVALDPSVNAGTAYSPTVTQSSSSNYEDTTMFVIVSAAGNSYILNGTSLQTGNFNVQAASSGSVAGTLEANASGTSDILDLLNGSGTLVTSIGSTGNVLVKPSTNSASAFQIQNSTGGTLFAADTNAGQVSITGTNNNTELLIKSNGSQGVNTPQILITASNGTTEYARIKADAADNLFFGGGAGASATLTTAASNVGIGGVALNFLTTGNANIAVGEGSLQNDSKGNANVALGYGAAQNISGDGAGNGDNNVAIGKQALNQGDLVSGDVAVGAFAGNITGATTGSDNNTFLGYAAGNSAIGGDGDGFLSIATLQNATALGANAQVQASNTIVLGSTGTSGSAQVVIGSTMPVGTNLFGVSPVFYDSTTNATQTTNTITDASVNFTTLNVKVGMRVIFANGTDGGTITAVGTTTLTVTTSQSVSAQHFRIQNIGFQVTNTGTAYVQSTSTTAFQVENSAGSALLAADTTNSQVTITNANAAPTGVTTGTDSFNSGGSALPAQWTLYRAASDSTSTTSYNSAVAGDLRISPKTTAADNCTTGTIACVRVLEATPTTGDMTITTKLDTGNNGNGTNTPGQGIYIAADSTCTTGCTYLRIEKRETAGFSNKFQIVAYGVTAGTVDNSGNPWLTSGTYPDDSPVWLKVQRVGTTWSVSYSSDGFAYSSIGTFTEAISLAGANAKIGMEVNTTSADATYTTADFDFFNVTSGVNAATALNVSGTISITNGNLSAAGNINFANGADRTINIVQASSGAGNNLLIGAGQGANSGNQTGGNLYLQGGAGGGTGASGSVVVRPGGTNSTSTFVVQGQSGNPIFNVDTSTDSVTVGNWDNLSPNAFTVLNSVNQGILNVDTTTGTTSFGNAPGKAAGILQIANSSTTNTVSLQASATSASYTLALPTAIGSATQCLSISSVAGGVASLGYSTCGGSGGANVTLSNLTGPTAINTDLTFAAANHAITIATAASGAGNNLSLSGGTSGTGAFNGGNLLLQGGATGGSGTTGSVIVKANGTDSTTAFQVQSTSGNTLINADTTNSIVGIGTVATPGTVTLTTTTTGGTIATGNFFYKLTAIGPTGLETAASAEATVNFASGTTHTITATWSPVPGAVSYRLYKGTVTNSENAYFTTTTNSITDTGTAGFPGTPPSTGMVYANQEGANGNSLTNTTITTSGNVAAGATLVQQKLVNGMSGTTSQSVAMTSAVKPGNALILTSGINTAATITNISGGGVTWVKANFFTDFGNGLPANDGTTELWYGLNSTGTTSAPTIVVTYSAANGGAQAGLVVSEWSGITGLDQAVNSYGATATFPAPVVTPAAPGELFLAMQNALSCGAGGVQAPYTTFGTAGTCNYFGYYLNPTNAPSGEVFSPGSSNVSTLATVTFLTSSSNALNVNGNESISGKLTLNGSLGATSNVTLQNSVNSNANLQVLNAAGVTALSVNTNTNTVNIGGLAAPTGVGFTITSGGSLTASTIYYYKVTALDATGAESLPSAENYAQTTGTNKTINVSWTAVPGATTYRIYRGTSSGSENVYYTSAANSFTDTGAASTGGSPPTLNTSAAIHASNSGLTVQSTTNSTTALLIQNASGAAFLTVDTTNSQVILGTATNNVTFTTAGGTVASGTARHTKTIVLTPEYAGAVLDAINDSGGANCASNNNGTMTSAYDFTNNTNYYKWTTAAGTNQCYDVVVRVAIPSDFSAWATNPVSVSDYTSNTTNGLINIEARDTSNTLESAGCNFVNVTPGSTTTWATNTSTCQLSGTYTGGGTMTLRIRITSPASGDVRLGNIKMSYLSSF